MRKLFAFALAAFVFRLSLAAPPPTQPPATPTIAAAASPAPAVPEEQKVVFNTKSLKYHCATC